MYFYFSRLVLFLLTKQRQNEPIHFNLEASTIEDIIQFVMLNSRSTALLLNTFTMLPLRLDFFVGFYSILYTSHLILK